MRQRASGTVNPEMKKKLIYVLPDILFSFLIIQMPKENIMIIPKQISISVKSMLFDGCPTAKLRKKQCRALRPVCRQPETFNISTAKHTPKTIC